MVNDAVPHVFISYVKEDKAHVDRLCRVLDAARIPYWRDRKDLAPGDAWKRRIREAIRSGAFTFLACFSDASRARSKSYMNEEVTLAVDEFRQRPPGATWLIPVRFDDGDVPEWDLGAGRTMEDINYVDLFGDGYAENAAGLIATIGRIMGPRALEPSISLAVIEEAQGADRCALLSRLTKEMLLDQTRRIELDELIRQEARRVLGAISDETRFPLSLGANESSSRVVEIVERAIDLWNLVSPLCWSLQVAARWADKSVYKTWTTAVRAIATEGLQPRSGSTALLHLRTLPALCLLQTGGVASYAQGRWDLLSSLAVETRVPVYDETVSLVDAIHPYVPFPDAEQVPNVLARSAIEAADPRDILTALVERRVPHYYTPVEEWLHHVLRPLFADQFVSDGDYETNYNATELFFGLLSQDAAIQHKAGGGWRTNSHWFGRSTWANRYSRQCPVDEIASGLTTEGRDWPPLRAGLFGGDSDRASTAVSQYAEVFGRVRSSRH
ncbi:toll/interleukin-1 receptor domain-containing protein [uncultured Microbacterium sp.]|uniref:toll/interleukin-1 receptor domain-containing protein n=1 Tax=uncultured Microbacterium sp. TaxID=191216 RepID=UPI0025F9E369|nr:toll/interleukin-1 receptor domain-containing protein [uncultured Microbacterium sp.]